jgi:hypothetical protein
VDIVVSSDEDAVLGPKPGAPTEKKTSAIVDAGDGGMPLAEPNASNPISSGTLK